MSNRPLNEKTQAIYDFLVRCAEERGLPPTIREIGEEFGIRSTNGVRHHLTVLERAGLVRRDQRISRGVALAGVASRRASSSRALAARVAGEGVGAGIPIVGRVAAGSPLLAEENIEGHLSLEALFPAEGDLFALRVRGQSMRDRGILDGDLVVVRSQEHARDGEAVVALLGDEATVKTLRRVPDGVELVPANPDFPVLQVGQGDEFRIAGVVVGLVRGGPRAVV